MAIIGLAVSLFGIGLAVAALKESTKSRKIADDSLSIAREQHQVWLDQMNARAKFDLTVEVEGQADDLIEGDPQAAGGTVVVWKLGIKNNGRKAANDVGVNFLIPTNELAHFAWVTATTNSHTVGAAHHVEKTDDETLPGSDGQDYPAQYIHKVIERIGLRTHVVLRAEATFIEPLMAGGEIPIPVKFKVWADELPDDQEAEWVRHETKLRGRLPSA